MVIKFFVPGIPRPAGSKRGIPIYLGKSGAKQFTGHVAMMDASGEKGKDWRSDIKVFAKQEFKCEPIRCPVIVEFEFVFARPKSHYGTGKNANIIKENAPYCHISRPDVLKLSRAVEDALTGIIWHDDSQIWCEEISKRYGDTPGVFIRIDTEQNYESK